MVKALALSVLVLVGCGEEPPSCQQAVSHYYGAGCELRDSNGRPFTEGEIVASCKQSIAASTSSDCDAALEDLRFCFDSVPSPAMTNADCDCSVEQDAVLTCQ